MLLAAGMKAADEKEQTIPLAIAYCPRYAARGPTLPSPVFFGDRSRSLMCPVGRLAASRGFWQAAAAPNISGIVSEGNNLFFIKVKEAGRVRQ